MRGVDVAGAEIDSPENAAGVPAGVTADELAEPRPSPWDPQHEPTVMICLRVILEEEWEHHRYAVPDLDTLS